MIGWDTNVMIGLDTNVSDWIGYECNRAWMRPLSQLFTARFQALFRASKGTIANYPGPNRKHYRRLFQDIESHYRRLFQALFSQRQSGANVQKGFQKDLNV